MHKILVDTCVWLDLAKDPEQQALLNAVEQLIDLNQLTLIVPRTVLDEFARNKARIIKESNQSLSSMFKRVKDVVEKFGDPKRKKNALEQLNNVDYKIPLLGENASDTITRIEKLLSRSAVIETTDEIKLRAIDRAIEKRAPFHRSKNSINDAIIMETYAFCIQDRQQSGIRYSFVTHNKNDFSVTNGNERIPHPDFAICFSKIKSKYFIKLSEAIHRISPNLVTEIMIEEEWFEEPRSLTEILKAEEEFFDRIWYDRHQMWIQQIENGKHKIVNNVPKGKYNPNVTPKKIYDDARKAALRVEKKYGKENLGPYSKFDWGMMNGKLSTLRWVTGSEWDFLDT